jgi:hypothetical protein
VQQASVNLATEKQLAVRAVNNFLTAHDRGVSHSGSCTRATYDASNGASNLSSVMKEDRDHDSRTGRIGEPTLFAVASRRRLWLAVELGGAIVAPCSRGLAVAAAFGVRWVPLAGALAGATSSARVMMFAKQQHSQVGH